MGSGDRHQNLGPGSTGFGPGPHGGMPMHGGVGGDYANTLQHPNSLSNVPVNSNYNTGSSTVPTSPTPTGN